MLCKRLSLNPYFDNHTAAFDAEFAAEGAISVRQAARLLPPRGSKEYGPDGGKPVHRTKRTHRDGKHTGRGGKSAKRLSYTTIWRYIMRGFEGQFLEAEFQPGGLYTTAGAVMRFCQATRRGREARARGKHSAETVPFPVPTPTTSREQQFAAAALDRELGFR